MLCDIVIKLRFQKRLIVVKRKILVLFVIIKRRHDGEVVGIGFDLLLVRKLTLQLDLK